jgi:hypothetical protein
MCAGRRLYIRANGKGKQYWASMELLSELVPHSGAIPPSQLLLHGLPSSGRELCELKVQGLRVAAGDRGYSRSSAGDCLGEHDAPGKGSSGVVDVENGEMVEPGAMHDGTRTTILVPVACSSA